MILDIDRGPPMAPEIAETTAAVGANKDGTVVGNCLPIVGKTHCHVDRLD